jgi:[glutamine synthetase] adenylyltransferase / [glutamine synthetase]-adenylyl-L-tyrosine phosphorylase
MVIRYAADEMEAAFAQINFNEPGAAEANLGILRARLPAKLWERLPTLLAQLPGPDDALNFLERYLREAPAGVARHLEAHPASLHYLLSLFSYSRFLSESLVQQPELILWLDRRGPNEGLERMKSRDDVLEDCYRFSTMAFELPPAVFLARFKRREYLRITLRDVLNLATLSDTCLELSNLADVLIERALRLCAQRLENLYGVPQWRDASGSSHGNLQPARMTVLALGKLGGQELNYSSDIDLIFLYDHDGETAGGEAGAISNPEYFVRLAQATLKMLSEATPEGAVFRIDMRLRPEGAQGDLVISLATALEYYRTRGREWEFQMLIKARVCAGETSTGEEFLREIHTLVYPLDGPREFRAGIARAVVNARAEISRKLDERVAHGNEDAALWNVKLSPGGIRDIEFVAQCLQRIYGGRDSWISGRGAGTTLVALQHLHDKGYLSQRVFYRLSSAYEFLRKVEHRLQLRDGLQMHELPRKAEARSRIARRSGIEGSGEKSAGEEMLERIRRHFDEVREIYQRVVTAALPNEASGANASPAETAEHFFRRDSVYAVNQPLSQLRAEFPAIAGRLEHYRAQGDVFARRGLEKYVDAARHSPALLRELEREPARLDCAAALFARSDFAAEMLVRYPEAIGQAGTSPGEARKQKSLAFPHSMTSLRIAQREASFGAAACSILGETKPFETFAEMTRAAENSVRGALRFAAEENEKAVASGEWRVARESSRTETASAMDERALRDTPFVVMALGRLGTGEFDIGSDADVAFFAATASENEIDEWRRLAERFIRAAGSYTSEGLLLPVDTRLRPRGGEGEIVQSVAYLLEYFAGQAQAWEAATYLKARPVAGNFALGDKLVSELREILRRRFCAGNGGDARELARQLVHMREKLERERPEGAAGFKCAAGGFFDIDYVIAHAALSRGAFVEMPRNVLEKIEALETAGALRGEDAKGLREAATFYRSLDHAIRLVLGRSSSTLPEPAQIPRVEALMKEWSVDVGTNLRDEIAARRESVREIYRATVMEGAE